ncbi:MAG TPA: hypothetical protein VML58_10695 [Burkholderiaceae bacterium]|nr:hypothetical protein [Burkholderiaceae bacterium]
MNAIPRNIRLFAGIAGMAIAAAFVSTAYAQSGELMPVSRADVKAQTRAANKAGEIATGEEDGSIYQPKPVSLRTRADRKAETLAANKNGGLGSPGQRLYWTYNVMPRELLAKSTKSGADGKAETRQAIRDHKMVPAGEATL